MAPLDGGAPLLTKTDLKVNHGRRYGLIGHNGCGKTTLLRHLEAKEFEGIPKHLRIHLVQQEMEGTDKTVLETVLAADTELTCLLEE
eukprot:UN29837